MALVQTMDNSHADLFHGQIFFLENPSIRGKTNAKDNVQDKTQKEPKIYTETINRKRTASSNPHSSDSKIQQTGINSQNSTIH